MLLFRIKPPFLTGIILDFNKIASYSMNFITLCLLRLFSTLKYVRIFSMNGHWHCEIISNLAANTAGIG
jgi:hypothetical protein